ncbi:hypothetical protein [Streptomyces lydicus]|uniref:hypothetical protein n=1 Tax=Streptomyces lydicus TaxID=47763 RepID=UPI0037B6252B
MFDGVDPDFFPAHVYVPATPDAFARLMADPPGRRQIFPLGVEQRDVEGRHRLTRRLTRSGPR